MAPDAQFTISSQRWLKALIVAGTITFAVVALVIAEAGLRSSNIASWITALSVAGGCAWLVAVGIKDIRYFGVVVHVDTDQVKVDSTKGSRMYPLGELNLKIRPISNTVELSHPNEGCLFVADMYALNVGQLIQLFEWRFKREA